MLGWARRTFARVLRHTAFCSYHLQHRDWHLLRCFYLLVHSKRDFETVY